MSTKAKRIAVTCVMAVLFLLLFNLNVYAAVSEGYWQYTGMNVEQKNYTSSNAVNITHIEYEGPHDGFSAGFFYETLENKGRDKGKYRVGVTWSELPQIMVPGEKYQVALEARRLEENTSLIVGGGVKLLHGFVSIPSPPGQPGGEISSGVMVMSKESKGYSAKTVEFKPFGKPRDINITYIVQASVFTDSTKALCKYNYYYRWVQSSPKQEDEITVTIDNNLLNSDVPPIIIEGRLLLPLRSILEALGAEIGWDGATRTITAMKQNTTVILTVDHNDALVNGIKKNLDVPATIINSRTLVPARFLAESFGAQVNWDANSRTVTIVK